MRQSLSWLGWMTLFAAIIAGTLTLLAYWSPRGSVPAPVEAQAPAKVVAPTSHAVPTPPEVVHALRELRLAEIRERRRRLEKIASGEHRCYGNTLMAKVDGAWTNVGYCDSSAHELRNR